MKTITFLLAGGALIVGLAAYGYLPWSGDTSWMPAAQTVNQTTQKCLPGEMLDEKTKKCVKK